MREKKEKEMGEAGTQLVKESQWNALKKGVDGVQEEVD